MISLAKYYQYTSIFLTCTPQSSPQTRLAFIYLSPPFSFLSPTYTYPKMVLDLWTSKVEVGLILGELVQVHKLVTLEIGGPRSLVVHWSLQATLLCMQRRTLWRSDDSCQSLDRWAEDNDRWLGQFTAADDNGQSRDRSADDSGQSLERSATVVSY